MTSSRSLQDDLCVKLRAIGLPQQTVLPIVNSINRSINAEGAENVVKRLKQLKQAGVSSISGQKTDLTWIAHDSNGIPKGPWKPVWLWLHSASHKHRKIALNALMVYASLSLSKDTGPSRTQERKFLLSANQNDNIQARIKYGANLGQQVWYQNNRWIRRQFTETGVLPSYNPVYPDIREYCVQVYGSTKWAVRKSERMINNFLGGHAGREFQCFPEVKTVLGDVGTDYFDLTHPWNGSYLDWRKSTPSVTTQVTSVKKKLAYDSIGVVGFSQEPGFKFRAFASPNPVVQAALVPMKRYLLELISKQPWDCTHDQAAGVLTVQEWLKKDLTVHSVDLSDATNNFPLSFTMKVLEGLNRFPESTLLLFKNLSQSEFRLLWESKHHSVTWTIGQPLGTGPSFPAFALSHGLLALEAERLAGVPEEERGSTFLILGDDFITNHDGVHEQYRGLLSRLNCPVSEAKCLSSKTHGEFAGKLITSHFVYHGFKYKDISDLSFMDVIRSLGSQAISRKFLSEEQYRYCRLVQEFPEPFGLGFNPKGRPFSERYRDYLVLKDILSASTRERSKSTSAELINTFVYQATTTVLSNSMNWPADVSVPDLRITEVGIPTPENIVDQIRGEVLKPTTVERGDPRPNPLLGLRLAKIEDLISGYYKRSVVDSVSPAPLIEEEDDDMGFSP